MLYFETGTSSIWHQLSPTNDNQSIPVEYNGNGLIKISAILPITSTSNATIDILDNNNNSVINQFVSYSGSSGNIVLKVKVTAQNGTIKIYTITFLVPTTIDNDLSFKSFLLVSPSYGGSVFIGRNTPDSLSGSMPLPFNTSLSNPYNTTTDMQYLLILEKSDYNEITRIKLNNATLSGLGNGLYQTTTFKKQTISLINGINTIDITVETFLGSTYTYTFYVNKLQA
jgi:hypothetical protein